MTPVEYPPWVPPPVVTAAGRMVAPCEIFIKARDFFSDLDSIPGIGPDDIIPFTVQPDWMDEVDMEAARRLTTAPEMRAVWQRLQGCLYNADGVRARREKLFLDGPETHDDALAQFFWDAVSTGQGPDSATIKRMAAEAEREQELAAQLRQEAAAYEWLGEEPFVVFSRAAELLEQSASSTIRWVRQIPGERSRGGRHDKRSYAVSLATTASHFFIFPSENALHTVIATMTAVRFGIAGITNKHVEYWLDAHAKKQG
jgi:hypothetical protein